MSRRGSPFNYHPPNDVVGQRLSRQGQESNMDTQRSLQEASAALETAFDRIRQVRRNLLRFSETLPADGATPATTNRDGISPGHEALLLSGGPTESERGESRNLSSGIAPWSTTDNREMVRPPHISAPVSPSIQPTSTGYNPPPPQHPYTTDLPAFLQLPPVPSVVPPRFSRQTTFNTQQGAGAETAATTHGLRVAAREANSIAQDIYRERSMDLASLATDYDRRYAQFRAAAAPFSSLPLPPLDDFGLVSMRRDGRRYRSTLPSPPIPYSASPRTGEVYRSHWQWDRYPGMPDALSNPPVFDRSSRQNYLPRPPAIQRELNARSTVMPMSSNAPVFPMGPPPPPPPPPPSSFVPSPNTRTRPPPGDPYAMISGLETGNSSSSGFDNPDWTSDEFISWLFPQERTPNSLVPRRDPQNPDTIRITRTTTEGGSPPMPAGPRRRGWGMSVSLFVPPLMPYFIIITQLDLIRTVMKYPGMRKKH